MFRERAAFLCCLVSLLIAISDEESPTVEDPEEVCGAECNDRFGFDAIRALHSQLDDDANGNIDIDESAGFIREELHYEAGSERKQQEFHGDDTHISVRDLWEGWLKSEVHNWTIDDTIEWLTNNVDLPQYENNFIEHQVDGTAIPRLAAPSNNYMSGTLGIKDPIHRQKLALKAMDVVLFGVPKERRALWKDVLIVSLLTFTIAGGYVAMKQYKHNQELNEKMNQHIAEREKDLQQMQQELERVTMARDREVSPPVHLTSSMDYDESRDSQEEVSRLRAELEVLRGTLNQAEEKLRMKECSWVAPQMLQHWLQLTFEIETHYFNSKKEYAERQIATAREACEKLKKKRSSLVGAFVTTHGRQADAVDKTIQEARISLRQVTKDLQERTHRWKQIENLCGCFIRVNPGLPYLQTLLSSRITSGEESVSSRYGGSQEFEDDSDSVSAGEKDPYISASYD